MTDRASQGEGSVNVKKPDRFKDDNWAVKIDRAKEARQAGKHLRREAAKRGRARRGWPQ